MAPIVSRGFLLTLTNNLVWLLLNYLINVVSLIGKKPARHLSIMAGFLFPRGKSEQDNASLRPACRGA